MLDVRSAIDGGGAKAYEAAHIPGSIHTDYDKDGWRVTRNDVPFMLPSTAELEKLIGDLGIDEDSHVVVVPAGVSFTDFGSAARVYWTLKFAGVERGVDPRWRRRGLEECRAAARRRREQAVAEDFHRHDRQELPWPRSTRFARSKRRAGQPCSMRGRPAFSTARKGADRRRPTATFPARSISTAQNITTRKRNTLKPKAELAALSNAVPAGPVVAYCNTGHWAATDWFVLHEVLGREQVRLYDGSMAEWTGQPEAAG